MSAKDTNRKGKLKNNKTILFFLISLFFFSNLFFIFSQKNVWWDTAAYIGISKYIYSSGEEGLIEESRPLLWPIIIGLFGGSVLCAKILSLIFSSGAIFLTYEVSNKLFKNPYIALLSAFILAFTPTFFFFSKIGLSGIVAVFFSLLGVYFFLSNRLLFSGISFGFSFMSRFLELLFFIGLILFLISCLRGKEKYSLKDILVLSIGLVIPVFPYLIFNHFSYGGYIYPFLLQVELTSNTGWMWNNPWWFYFVNLIRENFIYLFFISGIYYLITLRKVRENGAVVFPILVLFSFFVLIKHKEMRFLLVLLPYLAIISSYGLIHFFKRVRSEYRRFLFLVLLTLFFAQSFYFIYSNETSETNKKDISFISSYLEDFDGSLWISNPAYALNYNGKVSNLIYYPTLDLRKINSMISDINSPDMILIDTCDIPCNPSDLNCPKSKKKFMEILKSEFKIKYKENYFSCERFVFIK